MDQSDKAGRSPAARRGGQSAAEGSTLNTHHLPIVPIRTGKTCVLDVQAEHVRLQILVPPC